MQARLSVLALILGALAVSAVLAGEATNLRPDEGDTWSVKVETSGGFTGRGRGSLAVSSDGKAALTPLTGGQARETKLSADDVRKLTMAVKQARPAGWMPRYKATNVADGITYNLTLKVGAGKEEKTHKVIWEDGSKGIPEDLQVLIGAVEKAWQQASKPSDK